MEDQNRSDPTAILTMSPAELDGINRYLNRNPWSLLQIPGIRSLIAGMRIEALDPAAIRTFDGDRSDMIDQALEHNLDGLTRRWALDRPTLLIQPLVSLTAVNRRIRDLSVLTVGPRTEAELLTLIACGFQPANIRGLDLISYSPLVDVGDMHAMPYPDNSFDVVIAGWVLAYSENQRKAASEIVRVAKTGAYVAIGCEHNAQDRTTQDDFFRKQGMTGRLDLDSQDATWSEARILDLFEGHVDKVVFVSDESGAPGVDVVGVMVIFRLA